MEGRVIFRCWWPRVHNFELKQENVLGPRNRRSSAATRSIFPSRGLTQTRRSGSKNRPMNRHPPVITTSDSHAPTALPILAQTSVRKLSYLLWRNRNRRRLHTSKWSRSRFLQDGRGTSDKEQEVSGRRTIVWRHNRIEEMKTRRGSKTHNFPLRRLS